VATHSPAVDRYLVDDRAELVLSADASSLSGKSATLMRRGIAARSADRLGDVLSAIAWCVIDSPRWAITIALLVMVGTAVFGIPVADSLSEAGFQDPNTESALASTLLATKFGQADLQMLITVNSDEGVRAVPQGGSASDDPGALPRSLLSQGPPAALGARRQLLEDRGLPYADRHDLHGQHFRGAQRDREAAR
jgi:hypothetical protein